MKSRFLIISILLLLTLPSTIYNQTASSHLVSLLQVSNQQLQAIAALGASQQAFKTLTSIVNNILSAMQKMSLPYYQNQLTLLNNQQTSLLNRLTVLQAQIAANTTMLLKSTSSVSSALNAQVAYIGGNVFQYQNTVNPKIHNFVNTINSINSQNSLYPNQFLAFASNQTTLQPLVTQVNLQANSETTIIQNSFNAGNIIYPKVGTLDSNIQVSDIPYCARRTYNINPPTTNTVIFTFNIVATNSQMTNLAYDLYQKSFINNILTIYICDRSRSTFTFIPAINFIDIYSFDN